MLISLRKIDIAKGSLFKLKKFQKQKKSINIIQFALLVSSKLHCQAVF